LPSQILHEEGTPTVWANSGDYVSTASGFTRTHALNLTSIANGSARQGAKADLGATRARLYAVRVGIEFDVAPTAGNVVEFYWSGSFSATAGTGNDGGASGSDAAYKAGEEAEWKKQLMLIGTLTATNDAATTVQYQWIGTFTPNHRYGQVIVVNTSGQAFEGDAVEMFVALVPVIDESQ
jgi:hypothetical protein